MENRVSIAIYLQFDYLWKLINQMDLLDIQQWGNYDMTYV